MKIVGAPWNNESNKELSGQLDQISRQLEKIQLSLNKLADQHKRQEPGLTRDKKDTR